MGAWGLWEPCHGAAGLSCAGVCPQIENASEVLITPLEKFRKEQIGAAKVSQAVPPSWQELAHCRVGMAMAGGLCCCGMGQCSSQEVPQWSEITTTK